MYNWMSFTGTINYKIYFWVQPKASPWSHLSSPNNGISIATIYKSLIICSMWKRQQQNRLKSIYPPQLYFWVYNQVCWFLPCSRCRTAWLSPAYSLSSPCGRLSTPARDGFYPATPVGNPSHSSSLQVTEKAFVRPFANFQRRELTFSIPGSLKSKNCVVKSRNISYKNKTLHWRHNLKYCSSYMMTQTTCAVPHTFSDNAPSAENWVLNSTWS